MHATLYRFLIWGPTLLLTALGLVMVGSATFGEGGHETALNWSFLIRQGAAAVIGLALALVIGTWGDRPLRSNWVVVTGLLFIMGLLILLPLKAEEVNGAKRWLNLGPIKLQPSELAKIGLIVIAAWYFARLQERVRVHWYGVLLPLIGFALMAGLVYMTRDLGSVVVMFGVLWILLLFAGAPWFYCTVLAVCLAPLAIFVSVFQEAYRRDRMLAFMDPWAADGPAGYHLRQSYLAFASGGTWGTGLGQGESTKSDFVPEHHTDFIFAVIGEELGMVGAIAVAAVFLILIASSFHLAGTLRDRHAKLLAAGSAMLLGMQAFGNMMVVTGALPTKGLTLPFISYGGTSLVVSLVTVGLLESAIRRLPEQRPHSGGTTRTRIGGAPIECGRRRPAQAGLA